MKIERKRVCLISVAGASVLLGFALKSVAMNTAQIYGALLEDSHWQARGTALECELSQNIPEFGEGRFRKKAGEELEFVLRPFTNVLSPGAATLVAQSPAWKHNQADQPIATVEVTDDIIPVQLGRPQAAAMLAQLKQGMMPSFIGPVTEQPDDVGAVKVVISSVNFQPAYQEYIGCLSQLLPVSFRQIARSAIFFDSNDTSLSLEIQEQLDLIARYVKADKRVRRIFIDGHTDNVGDKRLNKMVSQRRAAAVIDYFKRAGVEDKLLVSRFHGDRYPALKNDTAENRARNRRVTIRLER